VLTIDVEQIESITTAESDCIDGIAKLDKRLSILLNADGLLAGIELAA
jgi:hypothetical protein